MGWMSEVEEGRNDEDMKEWWCPSEIWELGLRSSTNYAEEGEML